MIPHVLFAAVGPLVFELPLQFADLRLYVWNLSRHLRFLTDPAFVFSLGFEVGHVLSLDRDPFASPVDVIVFFIHHSSFIIRYSFCVARQPGFPFAGSVKPSICEPGGTATGYKDTSPED